MQQDEPLLADMRLPVPGEGFRLWWLGQSGFLVRWRSHALLFDPYLSDSLTAKYAGSDKPHVRMTGIPIRPAALSFVDVVTASHIHTDHLDPDTLMPLLAGSAAMLVAPESIRGPASERSGLPDSRVLGLDDGVDFEAGPFRFHGVAAAHNDVERDAAGRCKYLGFVVRFGPWTIYHAGDTKLHAGLARAVRPFHPDVALLPINGDRPERRVAGNLDGREAAELAKEIGARLAIPMHYEMFEFNTASPKPFMDACVKVGQEFRIMQCGERWSSDELPTVTGR